MTQSLTFGLLVFLCPIMAFIASNISWFDAKQVWGSLIISCLLGLLCGWAFIFLPAWISGCAGALLFCALSERLLNALLPRIWGKIIFVLLFTAIFAAISFFFGLIPLCVLLGIYLLFSLWDLRKNRGQPKRPLPLSPEPGQKSIEITKDIPQFPLKPNIYILFLESIHSAEALRALYGHDDGGLEDFLRASGFSIYSGSSSNEFGTTFSLNCMLNMDSAGCVPIGGGGGASGFPLA